MMIKNCVKPAIMPEGALRIFAEQMHHWEAMKFMFPFLLSTTARQKLDDVLSRMKNHPAIEGILLMGSAAGENRSSHGDFDLALIVRDPPKNILGINTFVEGTFAEIFFYSCREVDAILKQESIDPSSKEGWIVNWSRDGRIVHDPLGYLVKLKERSRLITDAVSYTSGYQSWQRMNYNLVQNLRYFHSNDETYHQALDLKLAYCIVEAFVGYFNVRKLSWRGEKEAVIWLKEHDARFFSLLEACLQESDRTQKMHLYEKMVSVALEPVGGLWERPVVSVVSTGETDEKTVQAGLDFWTKVVGSDK
jgi:hypothetical protein